MHVFATAGHVDHGKSTLVRALTGSDPDRLAEEQRRGLSIRLGYCWTSLPGVGDVAFVDVPGHERFVTTMLAGVGPVTATMFVVAADDPWMPQAAEHLAALDALGVEHGVLVVTRADLADPTPMLARARDELARTALAGAAAVAVSGRTGQGLDELRAELARVAAALPGPDPEAAVRLWVDRRFHVRGTGTVVTGTLPAGTIRAGDTLALDGAPDGQPVRVRALESLGVSVASANGAARVALDLGGRAPDSLVAGTALVTPGAFEPATVIDVRLTGDEPVSHRAVPQRPVLHVGSSAEAVHARPLDGSLCRLTLARALPLRIGDRALLRDPGSRRIWGVEVLDPAPPSLRRRGAAQRRAAQLARADGTLPDELHRRGVVRRSLLQRIGAVGTELPDGTVSAGDWLIAPDRVGRLQRTLVELVEAYGSQLLPGVSVAEALQALRLPDRDLLPALLGRRLRLEQGRVVPVEGQALPAGLAAAFETLQTELGEHPFTAPDAARLADLGLDVRGLAVLARAGLVLRLDATVVLLPGAADQAVAVLRGLPQPFTTSQARSALGTSRRVALPLLAHLDRSGRTRRGSDDRRTTPTPESSASGRAAESGRKPTNREGSAGV